ncbi:MAG: lipid-binding SYLF domain-containing protein [Pyrinomonadaceae bacterium]
MRPTFYAAFLMLVTCCIFSSVTNAQKNQGKQLKSAVERVDKASAAFNEIMRVADKSIPRDLLKKANAIVVFPGAIKAGFIFAGQGGAGLAVKRIPGGWSAPAFMNMGGGSFGLQAGGQSTDYVMLIMNEKGMKGLLEDKFELGGEGSVAAGPVGRTAAASTNATMDAEILTYSRTKGVFAGLALKGVVISPDKEMNAAVYQKSAKEILGTPPLPASAAPSSLHKFANTVSTYSK